MLFAFSVDRVTPWKVVTIHLAVPYERTLQGDSIPLAVFTQWNRRERWQTYAQRIAVYALVVVMVA